jgi:protein phosphatase
MGTTLTAVLLGDDEITIAHVGDSRAYRLRDGELTRLTRDHSLVGEMVRRGAITEQEAEVHPQRSILTRALGPEPEVEVDTLSHVVRDGDIYMICSDGLTGMVSDAAIAEVLGSGVSMREAAEELIRRANLAGGVDNITVVAFQVSGSSTGPAKAQDDDGETGEKTIVAPVVVPPAAEKPTAAPAAKPGPARPQTSAAGGNGHVPPQLHSSYAADARRAETRRSRRWIGGIVIAIVILIGIGGAIVGSLNVYFLGANEQGLVTVYRGLPYDFGLSMYTRDYVTTTPASSLTPQQRAVLLDHKLRTRSDALDLAGQIERGELDAATSPTRGEAGGSGTGAGGATAP